LLSLGFSSRQWVLKALHYIQHFLSFCPLTSIAAAAAAAAATSSSFTLFKWPFFSGVILV